MQTRMYQFYFNAPLHISNAKADYGKSHTYLHSDSLLAAVMDTWARIGFAEWIDEFAQATRNAACPLVFTGAYPFVNQPDSLLLFFPKPYYLPKADNKAEIGDAKKFKKLEWIAWPELHKLLQGIPLANAAHIHGRYYTGSDKDFNEPITSGVQARVKRPRNEEEDAKPYYVDRLYFKENSGLFTIVTAADETWQKRCETALNVLQHMGLGTDRAVGNGQFNLQTAPFEWPELPSSEYHMNMGLYAPADVHELSNEISGEARFDTIKRGGWIGEPFNTYRKRSVYMFKEGSVLKTGAGTPMIKGSLFDLQPEIMKGAHPIYRSGISIFLPVQVSN